MVVIVVRPVGNNKSVITQEMMQHGLVALGLMLSLGLRPRDNIQPSGNITHVAPFLG